MNGVDEIFVFEDATPSVTHISLQRKTANWKKMQSNTTQLPLPLLLLLLVMFWGEKGETFMQWVMLLVHLQLHFPLYIQTDHITCSHMADTWLCIRCHISRALGRPPGLLRDTASCNYRRCSHRHHMSHTRPTTHDLWRARLPTRTLANKRLGRGTCWSAKTKTRLTRGMSIKTSRPGDFQH